MNNPLGNLGNVQPPTDRYNLPGPGRYHCELTRCMCFQTEAQSKAKGELAWVPEFKILEAQQTTEIPPTPAGSMGKWYRGFGHTQQVKAFAQREVVGFLKAFYGDDPTCNAQVDAIAIACGDARNLLMGLKFGLEVRRTPHRKGERNPDGSIKQYDNAHFLCVHPEQAQEILRRLAAEPTPKDHPPKPAYQPQAPAQPAQGGLFGGAPMIPYHPQATMMGQGYQPNTPHPAYPTPAYAGQPAPMHWGNPYGAPAGQPAPAPNGQPPPPNPFTGGPMQAPPGMRWDPTRGGYFPG